jgi:hypothetical protein
LAGEGYKRQQSATKWMSLGNMANSGIMKKALLESLKKLAAMENAFLKTEFLAPVVRGRGVAVKIAGVRCELAIHPADFRGWGIFRAESHKNASLVREATGRERQQYLRLFPAVRLIVCRVDHEVVLAVPGNPSDTRFRASGPVSVELCAQLDLFDAIVGRFDLAQFWFEQIDPRADPAAAAYLRREIQNMSDPDKLERPGLTAGQRFAYALEYTRRAEAIIAKQRRNADARLTEALAHAGAILTDFAQDDDAYRVTYTVDGQRHVSIVRKCDLTVHSAGICLSGQDRDFDLQSLVGVLREGNAMFGRRQR